MRFYVFLFNMGAFLFSCLILLARVFSQGCLVPTPQGASLSHQVWGFPDGRYRAEDILFHPQFVLSVAFKS